MGMTTVAPAVSPGRHVPTSPDHPETDHGAAHGSGETRPPWRTRQRWPILFSLVFVALGMAYMLFWGELVHHPGQWATGQDMWGIFQGAHYVGWGSLGGVYTPGNGVVAFPGMEVLLAPVAMVTGHFNMTEPWGPFTIPRPTTALVLMPIELLLGVTVLFATNTLADRLGVPARRRIWLCLIVGMVAWPVVAVWGHAEDILALTFALEGLLAMMGRKWAAMGWLFGLGIVMQPLVALLLPLLIGATPQGRRAMLMVRSVALSAVLLGVAFLGNAADTFTAVVKQPTPPAINHATPWVALAPKLVTSTATRVRFAKLSAIHGHPTMTASVAGARTFEQVSGGAGRLIDVVLAVLVGIYVWRRPQPAVRILWLAAAVLASRCFFEPVMTPYYLAPPLIMSLIMVSRQPGKRFWAAVILALEVTVFAYHHLNPWVWWLPVVAGLGAVVALGYPGDLSRHGDDDPDQTEEATDVAPDGPASFEEPVSTGVGFDREPALL